MRTANLGDPQYASLATLATAVTKPPTTDDMKEGLIRERQPCK